MSKFEKLRYLMSEYRITSSIIIIGIVIAIYMFIFITIPSWKTSGISQLLYWIGADAALAADIFFLEKSNLYDPDTSTHEAYRLTFYVFTIILIAILCFVGYQAQALY